MVPYEIRVKALNVAGCGEQQKVYCFTQEGGMHVFIFFSGFGFESLSLSLSKCVHMHATAMDGILSGSFHSNRTSFTKECGCV